MNKTLIALATLFALLASSAFAQSEMVPKTPYKAGASVKNSYFGISLTVPQGFVGGYSQDNGKRGFAAATPDGNLALILVFQHGLSLDAYETRIVQPVPVGKFNLEPRGSAQRSGNLVFVSMADEQNGVVGFSAATVGSNGSSVVMVGLAVAGMEQTLFAQGDALLGSLKYFKGQIAGADAKAKNTWKANLSGKVFSRSGGAGFNQSQNGSVSDNSSTEWTLCQNGQYAYLSKSISSVSIPGGDGFSSSSSDRSNGTWAVEFATQDAAILVLTDEQGGQTRVTVMVKGNSVLVDGAAMRVRQAGC